MGKKPKRMHKRKNMNPPRHGPVKQSERPRIEDDEPSSLPSIDFGTPSPPTMPDSPDFSGGGGSSGGGGASSDY